MDIIQAITEARKAQNITQQELAERSGVNQANISRIENGNRIPTLNVLNKLVSGLGMTLKLEPMQSSKE